MEIYNILTGVVSTFNIIRKILRDDFENIDLDKLVEILKTLDKKIYRIPKDESLF